MRVKHVPEPPTSVSPDGRDATREPTADATSDALARIRETQTAIPLVPSPEADCCARLVRRAGVPSRDVSRTWLTFLRGIGLAEETTEGFRRTRTEPTPDRVRRGLIDGVVGAREIADALLADGDRNDDPTGGDTIDDTRGTVAESAEPIDATAAFTAVREAIPRWERTRTDDWTTVWRERTNRLLGWFCVLELAVTTAESYRATETLRVVIES